MTSRRSLGGRRRVAVVAAVTGALGFAGLGVVLPASGATQATAAATTQADHRKRHQVMDLQLLSFNDFHGHLEANDPPQSPLPPACDPTKPVDPCTPPVGGVEYLAQHVDDLRANQPDRTLTVAAGDLIGGSTFLSGLFQDQPAIEALNVLGLDVSSVGNHEFDEGTAELRRMVDGGCHPTIGCFKDADGQEIPYDGAEFEYLAANVVEKSTGEPFLPGTTVKEVQGVKVGFIGMTLEATPALVSPAGVENVEFLDEVETANKHARLLRNRGVKSIVVLMHEGGYQSGTYNGCTGISGPVVDIAKQLHSEIDLVVTGHTHQPYVCNIQDPEGQRRLVTSAASYGQVLTETHLRINTRSGQVMRNRVTAENHLVTRDVEKHEGERELIAFWKDLAEPLAAEVVGTLAPNTSITGHSDSCRCTETPMADLVADAILWGTDAPDEGGAQIAFMNTGGVRASLVHDQITNGEQPGEITFAETYAVAPFNNILVTVDMTGAEIEAVLNQQYQRIAARGSRPMLSLGVSKGFTYEWAWEGATPEPGKQPTSATTGGHVVPGSMKLNGQPIVADQVYRVGTLNFLADGGDSFTAFQAGENRLGGSEDLANLRAFLEAHPGLTPPADRVTGL